MEQIELVAPTYQQAVDEALDELQRDLEEVEIEVLEEGSNGVKVRVTAHPSVVDDAQDWLLDLLDAMEIDCEVGLIFDPDSITFHIESDEDVGALIGRKGQTLDAIQYLMNVAFGPEVGKRLIVDVQDYRRRHNEKLIEQAQEAADRVRTSGRSVRMAPMSAADRRVVHNELANFPDLETGSQGEEPHRYIVVHPRRGYASR